MKLFCTSGWTSFSMSSSQIHQSGSDNLNSLIEYFNEMINGTICCRASTKCWEKVFFLNNPSLLRLNSSPELLKKKLSLLVELVS